MDENREETNKMSGDMRILLNHPEYSCSSVHEEEGLSRTKSIEAAEPNSEESEVVGTDTTLIAEKDKDHQFWDTQITQYKRHNSILVKSDQTFAFTPDPTETLTVNTERLSEIEEVPLYAGVDSPVPEATNAKSSRMETDIYI